MTAIKETDKSKRKNVKKQFDQQADLYGSSKAHSKGDSLRIMTQLASERDYTLSLDIGTGPGFTAFAMAPFSQLVIATDIAPKMLTVASSLMAKRDIANVDLCLAAAEALPFKNNMFDLVTCRTAMHHFTDVHRALTEAGRVLKPGSVLLIADTSTPNDPDVRAWHQEVEIRRDPTHVKNLSVPEWIQHLTEAGFTPDYTELTRVRLDVNSWTTTSGTDSDESHRLLQTWASAPDDVVNAFSIVPKHDGNFAFSWPCLVVRAISSHQL